MFYGIATHDVSFIFAHFPCRNDVIKRKLTSNFRDNSVASYADILWARHATSWGEEDWVGFKERGVSKRTAKARV